MTLSSFRLESDNGPALPEFVQVVWRYLSWPQCFENKTDMTSDLRHMADHKDSVIHSGEIQIVESYKYLGAVCGCTL